MLKPSYKIEIDGEKFDENSGIISISLMLAINSINFFQICFGSIDEKFKNLKVDAGVSISLGESDDLNEAFSGTIDKVDKMMEIQKLIIYGNNDIKKLIKLRVNETYENQSSGEVVKDLAQKANVSVGEIEDGINFPIYFVDGVRNVYEHIKILSERNGFDFYVDENNKLHFKEYTKKKVHKFNYGENIIKNKIYKKNLKYGGVVVYGESPSSFCGYDTSSWITKREVKGSYQNEEGGFIISDPSIKDKEAAENAAKAKFNLLSRNIYGNLTVIGSPAVRIYDGIEIGEMENPEMNGEFVVSSIEHIIDKKEGFITNIEYFKVPE